jgi:hypothetical protein
VGRVEDKKDEWVGRVGEEFPFFHKNGQGLLRKFNYVLVLLRKLV